MRYGVEYMRKSEADYAEQHRERQEKNLHRRAREMGYKLEKIEKPTAEENNASTCDDASAK